MSEEKGAARAHQSIFSWKIAPAELKYQIENYDTLKITESYRGIAVLIVLFLLGLNVLLSLFGVIDLSGFIIDAVIFLFLSFFAYKGHRWAIVGIMIMWTLEKGVQLFSTPQNSAIAIVWWAIFMPYFFKALKVENEKIKQAPSDVPVLPEELIYCPKCGNKSEKDSKFCTTCGFDLSSVNVT